MSMRIWAKNNQSWVTLVISAASLLVATVALVPGFRSAFKGAEPTQDVDDNSGIVVGPGATTGDITQGGGLTPQQEAKVDRILKAVEAKNPAAFAELEQTAPQSLQALREAVAVAVQEDMGAAEAALERGDTKVAAAMFRRILEREKASGREANKRAAAAARHIGALAFLHDTEAALRAYREATELDSESLDGWIQLGHLLRRVGQLSESEATYQHVLELAGHDSSWQSIALSGLGRIHRTRGELDEAEILHKRALALNEKLGRKDGMATDLGRLGVIYWTRGELDEAEALYKGALALNEQQGREEGMAKELGNLGLIYWRRGELAKAEAHHKRALTLDEELGRKEGMAADLGNLGLIYNTRGELAKAEEHQARALALHEELGSKEGMAGNLGNLGLIYRRRGELAKAEEHYKRALALNEELGSKEGMAIQLGNLGVIYWRRGELAKAEEHYKRALALDEELGRKEGMAIQLANLGALYKQRGQHLQARTAWLQALRLYKEVGIAKWASWTQDRLDELAAEDVAR